MVLNGMDLLALTLTDMTSGGGKGAHSTLDSVLASQPAASGLILGIPEDLFIAESYSLGAAEIHGQRFAYRVDSAKLNC